MLPTDSLLVDFNLLTSNALYDILGNVNFLSDVGKGICVLQARVVPLNHPAEAMGLFQQLLVPFIVEVRGERVYCDMGDYMHLMGDREREVRIRWIYETLVNPQEIRRSHLKSKPFREVYIAFLREEERSEEVTPFVVGVDRRYGRLDFRTAFVPTPAYLRNLRRGRLLWSSKK